MKAVGIIAEYNPLHYGHVYHIKEARRLAGSDAVVVAMSGNFVQRGEPAILDKWERTALALENGADVVIEIPTVFCLGNARQYASAGVKLLESINQVSHIAFGSESGDYDSLSRITKNLRDNDEEINRIIGAFTKSGYSYPRARSSAYAQLFPNEIEDLKLLENSNDILALEFMRSAKRAKCIPIKRIGAGYNEDIRVSLEYQSATAIRNAINNGENIEKYVPENVFSCLENAKSNNFITEKNSWMPTLKYALMSTSSDEIDNCPSGGEGLGNRIKSLADQATSWEDFVELVKTKRYTHTRISRLFLQIILGINRNNFDAEGPQYIRVLGLSNKGRELISELGDSCDLPVITNINKQIDLLTDEGKTQLELDIHASDVYNLISGRNQSENSDYRHRPILIFDEK